MQVFLLRESVYMTDGYTVRQTLLTFACYSLNPSRCLVRARKVCHITQRLILRVYQRERRGYVLSFLKPSSASSCRFFLEEGSVPKFSSSHTSSAIPCWFSKSPVTRVRLSNHILRAHGHSCPIGDSLYKDGYARRLHRAEGLGHRVLH